MRLLKKIAVGVACLVALYYSAFGVFYLLGYRVYRLPTSVMEPTIRRGEYAIGRLSNNYREQVSRFDLAIYSGSFEGTEQIYAKRVIGLPGERISITAKGIKLNGQSLTLPANVSLLGLGIKPCDVKVPNDAIFVLGDNTSNSLDSRYHGPIPKKDVVGYMVFKK